MRFILLLSSLCIILLSCREKKKKFELVNAFEFGESLGTVKDKKIKEASGLAVSRANPGMFWTLNDSGNDNEIFLIDEQTKIKLICKIKGIRNRDWEEIVVGPGPEDGKNYVYVADIGDNLGIYPLKYIYRFEEPTFTPGSKKIDITDYDTIKFRLPNQQKDTETLMVNPLTKDLYVVSKREKPVYLYKLTYPFSLVDTITAESLFSLPITDITSGAISPSGKEVVMKNYEDIYYWQVTGGKNLEQALKEKPRLLPYRPEPQGEAITWAKDTTAFYTISESGKYDESKLFLFKRNYSPTP
jgi:hypothetical protein